MKHTVRQLHRIQDEVHQAMRPFILAKLDVINAALPTITVRNGEMAKFTYSAEVQSQLDAIDKLANEAMGFILKREGTDGPQIHD
jgi:hypothetical protein